MRDSVLLIEQQMHMQINRYFTSKPLLNYAEQFIENKVQEALKFGQMTIIHYRMFGGNQAEVYQAAAAVELFILASDILDDLQDRDAPSKPWMQIPMSEALHVASSLLTLSQQAMMECTNDSMLQLSLVKMMNAQLLEAANGQMTDLRNDIEDEKSYLDMVRQKSSSIIRFACMTGVMLTGHPWHDNVADYAEALGISSQLNNDLRDLLKWDEKSDFLQRKRNLLTLFLVEDLSEEDSWINDYFEGRLSFQEIEGYQDRFKEACERTGTILYGSVMSRIHFNELEERLDQTPQAGMWKEAFLQMLRLEIE